MAERLIETHPLMHQMAARRIDLDKSQLDVASEVGVSQTTLCNWEKGLRRPSITKFAKLAAALGGEVTVTFKET